MFTLRYLIHLSLTASLPLALTAPASSKTPSTLAAREATADAPFNEGLAGDINGDLLTFTKNTAWPIPADELDVNYCTFQGAGESSLAWGVLVPDDSKYDTGGCGAGFLDNLRGRCGAITGWGCTYVGASAGTAALFFDTSDFCTEYDVTQAILAASYGDLNIPCNQAAGSEIAGGDLPDAPFGGV